MTPALSIAEPDPPPFDGAPPGGRTSDLADLFRRNRPWLLALLKLRAPRDAEDLLQETFLRASRQRLGEIRHPRAWLATIALNLVREQHRRRSVHVPIAETDGALPYEDAGSSAGQDEALLLKQIILSLPPTLAEVFVLSRFEGLTYPEIAQRCGVSTKTVEWRMSKALAICAARLKD